MAVAVPADGRIMDLAGLAGCTVATTHPRTTARFFAQHQVTANQIEITGAVEITPLLGVADAIVDLVSTGSTLAVNGLRPLQTVLESEAQLIVHPNLSPDATARTRQLQWCWPARSPRGARNT